MNSSNSYKFIDSIVIFITGLLIFTIGLHSQEIVGFDSRLYAFALEMFRHGFGWFPRTFQQYYPDYPVTAPFLIYLLAKAVGTLNKLIAVLPSAIAAVMTLIVTYHIGSLHKRLWGWNAVILSVFTLEFLTEARSIAFDQYVTLITTLCFYLVYSRTLLASNLNNFLIYLLFVLGFVFRGPIGLIIPTGVVCSFYLINKSIKKFLVTGIISALLLMVCFSLMLYLAYYTGGMSFLKEVAAMEGLGRIQDVKPVPYYFYFTESFGVYAISYPLMILMLPVVLFFKKQSITPERRLLVFLLGWIAVIFLGLSIPADKKVRYVMAMVPALALFSAYLFSFDIENLYLKFIRKIFYWLCFFFPALCLAALYWFHRELTFVHLNYLMLVASFVFFQLLMLYFNLFFRKKITYVLAGAAAAFVIAHISVVEPTNISLNDAREFVLLVEKIRHNEQAKLVFYREGWDGLAVKYFINMPQEEKLFFVANLKEFDEFREHAVFITSIEYYEEIPESTRQHLPVIMQGAIGHDKVVVFKRAAN